MNKAEAAEYFTTIEPLATKAAVAISRKRDPNFRGGLRLQECGGCDYNQFGGWTLNSFGKAIAEVAR